MYQNLRTVASFFRIPKHGFSIRFQDINANGKVQIMDRKINMGTLKVSGKR